MIFDTSAHVQGLKRIATNEAHSKMAGISALSFWCPDCNSAKKTAGRVSRGYKKGFRCASCEAGRQARIAAKKAA